MEFFRQIFNLEGLRGQKAALVIRLFYEEERQKAKERQRESGEIYGNGKEKVFPNLETPKHVHVELAKKAGIGKSSMANLLAVYRNRPDLFELVFDGTYTINKAYTHARARCNVLLDIMSTRNLLIRTRTRGYALGKVKKDKMSLSDSSYTHARLR